MNNTVVFLCSDNLENEVIIKKFITEEYDVISVTKMNLLVELYRRNPKLLIVDIEDEGAKAIELMKSVLPLDFIPVIYVCSSSSILNDINIRDEIVIPLDRINESINHLIKQVVKMKVGYDRLSDNYDTIDLINYKIKDLLRKNVDINEKVGKQFIIDMLNTIYFQNRFLDNKPEKVCILTLKNGQYITVAYRISNDGYYEAENIVFDSEDKFKFDIYGINGFSKNFNSVELSDISSSLGIFPKAVQKYLTRLNNFAGYAIGNTIIIGINYNKDATNYETDIIKTLATNFDLSHTIFVQMQELEAAFNYTIDALARASEANDDMTGNHIKRVNHLAGRLARELGMDEKFVKNIEVSAQMHDVGKIYIDKEILLKPGKLTDSEFDQMKLHTVLGERIIGDSEYLKMSVEICRNHHERYDGTGYPDGKRGEEIPLAARIVFLSDIYDALRSERHYKRSFTHEEACDIIINGDNRIKPEHFDPNILDAFKRINSDFKRIYDELK